MRRQLEDGDPLAQFGDLRVLRTVTVLLPHESVESLDRSQRHVVAIHRLTSGPKAA